MVGYVEMKNIMSSWLDSEAWHTTKLNEKREFQTVINEFETIGFEYFDFTLFEEIVREKLNLQFEECDDEFCDNIIDSFRSDIKELLD